MDKHLLLKITPEQLKWIDKRKAELNIVSRSAFIRLVIDAMMTAPAPSDTKEEAKT